MRGTLAMIGPAGSRRAAGRRSWWPRGSPAGAPSSGRSCRRRDGSRPSSRPCPTPSAATGRGAGPSRRRWRAGWRRDRPYCRATSGGMTPMPRVRLWKISLPNSRSSISSQKLRSLLITGLVSSIQPLGRSSLRPPMRSKLGWKRPPVAPSIRLSTYSRSRKAIEHRRDRAELHAEVAEEQRDVGDAARARTGSCGCTGRAAAPRSPSASRRRG